MYKFNTHLIGRRVDFYESLDSTNDFVKLNLHQANFPEGTVVLARYQTKGRGQMGNVWDSSANLNLTFSIVLYPRFLSPTQQFSINLCISTALQEAIKYFLPNRPVKVKWPNDLYVANHKIAGILIENIIMGNKINASIVGIGLNVNQENFPKKLSNPTSLRIESGLEFELQTVLEQICQQIELQYKRLKSGLNHQLRDQYLQVLFRFKEIGLYEREGKVFEGQIVDVNPDGQLVLETDSGIEAFANKQIRFVV